MKSTACVCIIASQCVPFILFGSTNNIPQHVHARKVGTNSVATSSNYPGMTNVLTATGTLIEEQLAEIVNPTTHKPMLMQVGASETSGGKQMTCYDLLAADGSTVTSFGAETASTSPVKASDFIDQYVTITGEGRELQGKSGKLIQIAKITAITKSSPPPESQPVVKVSGILTMQGISTSHNSGVMQNGTNEASGDKQMIIYVVTASDGSRVTSFGAVTASTSPVAIASFLNQPVTIVGWGRELQGKQGKLIQIRKITAITKSADAQPATKP